MFQPIGTAADIIVARIEKEFGVAAEIRYFKQTVRKNIRLGAGHPANMARYGRRLALIRLGVEQATKMGFTAQAAPDLALTVAINLTEHWYRTERKTFAVAAALGRGNRLSLLVLRELRLMLRVLRRSEYRGHFSGLVAFAVGSALEAAE